MICAGVCRRTASGMSSTTALRRKKLSGSIALVSNGATPPRSQGADLAWGTGNAFLDLPLEEKRKHPCDFKNGNFFGFREGFRIIGDTGVKDNSEA